MCNDVDTRLSFNFETTDRQMRKDMAAAVQDTLQQIGVEFKPVFTPSWIFFGTYATGANLATGKFDMAGSTSGFYPDPMQGVMDSFSCATIPSAANPSGVNNYHLCDPTLDDLMNAVNASADPVVRKTALDALQKYQYDNALIIPIYARAYVMAYLDRFLLPPTSASSGMLGDTFEWDVK